MATVNNARPPIILHSSSQSAEHLKISHITLFCWRKQKTLLSLLNAPHSVYRNRSP